MGLWEWLKEKLGLGGSSSGGGGSGGGDGRPEVGHRVCPNCGGTHGFGVRVCPQTGRRIPDPREVLTGDPKNPTRQTFSNLVIYTTIALVLAAGFVASGGLEAVGGLLAGAGEVATEAAPAVGIGLVAAGPAGATPAPTPTDAPDPLHKQIEEQLNKAKAKTGDVQISLYWANKSDLDLHVVCPSGETIMFNYKKSQCGGELDVDANANYATATANAVENVYWPKGKAPMGKYKAYVDFYSNHSNRPGCLDPSPFHVRVNIQGQTQVFQGTVGSKGNRKVLVHEFEIR
jgi:hypothetical protein